MAATQSGFAAADQRYYANTGRAEPVYLDMQANRESANTANLRLNYGTATPTFNNNGEIHVYHKSNEAVLAIRSGGTVFSLRLPTATNGTITHLVAGTAY